MWCPGQCCFPLHVCGSRDSKAVRFPLHTFSCTCFSYSPGFSYDPPVNSDHIKTNDTDLPLDLKTKIPAASRTSGRVGLSHAENPDPTNPGSSHQYQPLTPEFPTREPYMPRDTVNSSLIQLPINSAIPQCSDGSNILCPCPGPNSYHLLPGTTRCSCLPRTQIRTHIPAPYRLKIKKESYLFWLNTVVRLSNNSSCMSKSCLHAC